MPEHKAVGWHLPGGKTQPQGNKRSCTLILNEMNGLLQGNVSEGRAQCSCSCLGKAGFSTALLAARVLCSLAGVFKSGSAITQIKTPFWMLQSIPCLPCSFAGVFINLETSDELLGSFRDQELQSKETGGWMRSMEVALSCPS